MPCRKGKRRRRRRRIRTDGIYESRDGTGIMDPISERIARLGEFAETPGLDRKVKKTISKRRSEQKELRDALEGRVKSVDTLLALSLAYQLPSFEYVGPIVRGALEDEVKTRVVTRTAALTRLVTQLKDRWRRILKTSLKNKI